MTSRRAAVAAILLVAAVLLVGRWSAKLYTDYLWYVSLGAPDVWRAKFMAGASVAASSFVIASLFAFINLYAVRQSVVSLVLPRRIANVEIGEEVPRHYLLLAVIALSMLVGGLLTFPLSQWHEALLARIGLPFNAVDPYFGADLGFFVYWLPFESDMHLWSVVLLATVTFVVVALYALTPSLRWDRGTLYVSAYVRRHFTMLGGVVLLVLAWSDRLSMYKLLVNGSGSGGLFNLVDNRVVVPATLLLAVVTLCAAIVVTWAGWTGQTRIAFGAVSAVLVLSLVSRTLAPLLVRRGVDPAERRRLEMSYIATRLSYTRVAFGVDRMHAELLGSGLSVPGDAASRLAVWDGLTLIRAIERLKRARVSGDSPAWMSTPAGIEAAIVERPGDGAPETRETWNVARFDPSAADERGLPLHAPAALGGDDFAIAEPAVYDSAPAYSVLSDSLRQVAGVEMVTTRSRLMHAWGLQNFRLLFGELPANRPVIVEKRDVRQRVGALAPFFTQGSEVVPAFSGDTLYWILELYSASSTYPLAQRFTLLGQELNYFQHAATAIVHAASGRVRFLSAPSADPVAQTWFAQFPELFKPAAVMPRQLAAMLPVLTDGARAQALAFSAAGFRGDSLEVRHFASPDGADSAAAREPVRVVLPSTDGVSALWPLLDSTEHVRGVVAASAGAARTTLWIPLLGHPYRWGVVLDHLRVADTAVRESSAMRSALRVIPVSGRPLFVQSTFQIRAGTPPVLTRVAALSGDSVHTGNTLSAALGAAPTSTTADTLGVPGTRIRADSLYRVMKDALGRGDWVAFGRAFDALGMALRVPIR